MKSRQESNHTENQRIKPKKLATIVQNIFLTKKEKLKCNICRAPISKGKLFVSENENKKGTCLNCSPFSNYTLLPSGDAAMTRRSKKHSELCGIVLEWNQRRKRYERRGQFVELEAIERSKKECIKDQAIRSERNKKAAIRREIQDSKYIADFARAIANRYPNCPKNRTIKIAQHACEKHSGRVGRTAQAKSFDLNMIDLAVEAHIRHSETNYDEQFGKGKSKKEIRSDLKFEIQQIMTKWRKPL